MLVDYTQKEAYDFYDDRQWMPGVDIKEHDDLETILKKSRFAYDHQVPIYMLLYRYNRIRSAHYNMTLIQNAGFVTESVTHVNGARTGGDMIVNLLIDYVPMTNMNREAILSPKFWILEEYMKEKGKIKEYKSKHPVDYEFKPIECFATCDTSNVVKK